MLKQSLTPRIFYMLETYDQKYIWLVIWEFSKRMSQSINQSNQKSGYVKYFSVNQLIKSEIRIHLKKKKFLSVLNWRKDPFRSQINCENQSICLSQKNPKNVFLSVMITRRFLPGDYVQRSKKRRESATFLRCQGS